MSLRGTAVLATVLTVAGASIAVASKDRASDPVGDASPAFTDITAAHHGHGRCGKLRHFVAVADGDRATRSLTQLEIRAGGETHLIDVRDRRVRAKHRGDKTVFVFKPYLIGNPARYSWAATVGSNDTTPLEYDRVPDAGYIDHRLRPRDRFDGFHAGLEFEPVRRSFQGDVHRFVFKDRQKIRSRYTFVLEGPGGASDRYKTRTNCRGWDKLDRTRLINDRGGPGKWQASWRVRGREVARYNFTVKPEPQGQFEPQG